MKHPPFVGGRFIAPQNCCYLHMGRDESCPYRVCALLCTRCIGCWRLSIIVQQTGFHKVAQLRPPCIKASRLLARWRIRQRSTRPLLSLQIRSRNMPSFNWTSSAVSLRITRTCMLSVRVSCQHHRTTENVSLLIAALPAKGY